MLSSWVLWPKGLLWDMFGDKQSVLPRLLLTLNISPLSPAQEHICFGAELPLCGRDKQGCAFCVRETLYGRNSHLPALSILAGLCVWAVHHPAGHH